MISIKCSSAVLESLPQPIDPTLRKMLERRHGQLASDEETEFSELAHFVVVERYDRLDAVESEVGFPVILNSIEGTRYGDSDFFPSWEWIEDHGGWFELVFILTDDGFAHVLFVEDREGVDADLLAACRQACGRPTP